MVISTGALYTAPCKYNSMKFALDTAILSASLKSSPVIEIEIYEIELTENET